jgi:hypothetical protein
MANVGQSLEYCMPVDKLYNPEGMEWLLGVRVVVCDSCGKELRIISDLIPKPIFIQDHTSSSQIS